ncbi:MAG TPA: FtsX-like permease family protein [Anaeromyxobacteraceae bacterium]|nr:FtsX-like permease family protein [Anaeromyxobacteraceae bacterium]
MIGTDLLIAARNLVRHTKRNAFLAAAIAAVTGLLVIMGALTEGIRSAMLESASTLMTGHVNVGGFYKHTSGSAAPLVVDYEKVAAQALRLVPEIDYATVRVRGFAKGVSERSSMDLGLAGVDIGKEQGFRRVVRVKEGRLDDLALPGTILLFEDQAKRLDVRVGDAITLSAPTDRGMSNTADVRVAVVAKSVGILSSWCAFLPSGTLRQLYRLNDRTTGVIQLYLRDVSKAGAVAARLRQGLSRDGWRVMEADPKPYWEKLMAKVNSEEWVGQKLDVTTWEDEVSFLGWILSAIRGLTGVLMFILLAIVVVGIVNTLAIAIRERTSEIGTLRAIGMQRRKVLWLFLLEALLLGLVGTAAGTLLGVVLSVGVNAAHVSVPESVQMFLLQRQLTMAIAGRSLLGEALFILAVTSLAAVLPSLRAARLRPVTSMHHIG